MNRIYITLLLVACATLTRAQHKEICITVDDLPTVSYGKNDKAHLLYITNNLINTFKKHDIPAIGYVNEIKLQPGGKVDSAQLHLLELWLSNGLELGNHTYSHLDYHKTSLEEFSEEILKGEKHIRPLSEKYGKPLKFFRHPYLHVGNHKAAHDSLRLFLNKHGYVEAPVTVDNTDYLFAKAYFIAYRKGDSTTMKKIGSDYVNYMERKVKYFESSAMTLFGRPIKQILLLHASQLNADYMVDLAEMLKRNNYKFISQEEALTDEAYKSKITRYGKWGISWIDRWALSKGVNSSFFQNDPETPGYILEMNK